MTATPRFYTPRLRREAGLLDFEVASMDDENVFGPVLHRLTFGEAIERGLLSNYQVLVVGVDNETYRAWAERGEFVTPDGEKVTDARTLAGEIALAKAMRKYDLRRVLSFHSRVNAARRFSEDLPFVSAWMPARARPRRAIWSEHVSGAMSSGHRDRLLLRFRNLAPDEIALLSNARCLAEGVDIPTLDGVAFIDPRRSTIDIIQAVGRAIRKAPDKTLGTIVLPVFLTDEDPEQALDDSTFKNVWEVLKALRAHDEKLGEELDELRRNLGARPLPPRRPGKIKLDVPVAWVGAAFADTFNTRLVERTTESWELWYGLLQRYARREGHARPPALHREQGLALGGWVTNQLQLSRQSRLASERAERLERLPGWTWAHYETWWEANYESLLRFAEREGHASPLQEHVEGDVQLGNWVVNQRQAFKRSKLSEAQQTRLRQVPGWKWGVRDESWDRGLRLLRTYVAREDSALVPQRHVEEGLHLGVWVAEQRQRYREGRLEPERQAELKDVPGWGWNHHTVSWLAHYNALRRFTAREGHARPAPSHVEGKLQLGRWVHNQRSRMETLSRDQRAQLEALSGWTWRPQDDSWQRGCAALNRFIAREGHARAPTDHVENGYPLGRWLFKNRRLHRSGSLPPERTQWLESQAGWTWEPLDARWERAYALLVEYAQRHGAATPPVGLVVDGFRLGGWVNVQRTAHMRGKLGDERGSRLEQLPGWTWKPNADVWERGFAALEQYVARNGTANPSVSAEHDGVRVGQWVSVQRTMFKQGRLQADREQRLADFPGWTWGSRQRARAR